MPSFEILAAFFLKAAGAVYLVWLGTCMFQAKMQPQAESPAAVSQRSGRRAMHRIGGTILVGLGLNLAFQKS